MSDLYPDRNSSFFGNKLKSRIFSQIKIELFYFLFLVFFISCPTLTAQNSEMREESHLIKSMGMPLTWKPYFGPIIAWDNRAFDGQIVGEVNLGLYKSLVNPIIDLFGMAGEGYVRRGKDDLDGGIRLLGASRVFFMHGGIDYSFRNQDLKWLVSFQLPVLRGGPLRQGGALRIDWLPARKHSFNLGLRIPLGQPYMGKTRPKTDHVSLPKASRTAKSAYTPSQELEETLAHLRQAAHWINRFTIPFLDHKLKINESDIAVFVRMIKDYKIHMRQEDQRYPRGHTFEEEVYCYHRLFVKAFSLAVRGNLSTIDTTGVLPTTRKAREILLDEVIIPYNRLLGQKKRHDSILGFGSRAADIFETWLKVSSEVPAQNHEDVMYVFRTLIEIIDENRARSRRVWDDSRLVWIPLHYALCFEDHDTEIELDTIIERVVGQEFCDANDVHYVINELFQPELERMIHRAEDYHVLWIHDYRGLNGIGEPDTISYRLTVQAYLKALVEKVKAYEKTRKIPVYLIFLDQHYFEINQGRLWLEFLENPLEHKLHLPAKYYEWEKTVRQAQKELRAAVARSSALQADAGHFGMKWLLNKIKVHVNITNPSDLSFRSASFFRFLSFVPDNVMRDHRKITFYDVTEFDPGKGEAMYTGMGIGEHYVGPAWDDRSILARGPVLLSLKDAARELLLSQGFHESEIPTPLRPLPKPSDYDQMLDKLRAKGWTATAMQVHNMTGFGMKSANIVKAILYTLMPKGSHLYIPDSLWNSPFWGGMLVGAALRGCIVLVVSPALENAPSSGNPQMSRANQLFTRFVIIQKEMKEEIEKAGGLFKVGIYNVELDVDDVIGKLEILNSGIAQSQVFQRVFPFSPSVVDMIAAMPDCLAAQGFQPSYLSEDASKRKPKLHLKSQFFASERTIKTVVPLEEWDSIVRKYILARVKQTTHRDSYVDVRQLRAELEEDAAAIVEAWYKILPLEQRGEALVYLSVGSQNQDYRSMIMDGESLFIVGHAWAMIAYLDFVSLMGQTTWINDVRQLEELLPRYDKFWKWLGWYLKIAL